MSKKFEELVLLQFNNMNEQFKVMNGRFDNIQLQLTNFQDQMQSQFLEVRKDIKKLYEKSDTLDAKIDSIRAELKHDINDWSRAFDLHDRKIFQNEGEIKMVKAYIGMVDDSMLTPVLRDKDNYKPKDEK